MSDEPLSPTAGDPPPSARGAGPPGPGDAGNTPRFFIVGCQRSGTTLMRLALDSHPEIACFDEIEGYRALADGYPAPAAGIRRVGFKIPRWTELLGEPRIADEAGPEEAFDLYRGEPIIFLLRDASDTVASMLRLRTGGTSWLEAWGRPILEKRMAREEFRRRYASPIDRLCQDGMPAAGVGALYWRFKVEAYFDQLGRGWPVLGVAYELLVNVPEAVLRRVVAFLGLGWDSSVLGHHSRDHTEVLPHGLSVGETDPRRPIDARSVGRKDDVLSPEDQAMIAEITGDLGRRVRDCGL